MFTKLAKIKNIGSFKSFNWNIVFWKNNILYALNWHWKTTLTSIINSIKNNDMSSIAWRKTLWEIWDLECILNRESICYQIKDNKWKTNWSDLTSKDDSIIIFDDNYINENFFSERFEIEHKKSLHKIIFWEDWIRLNGELTKIQLTLKNERIELHTLRQEFNNIPTHKFDWYKTIDISKLNPVQLSDKKKDIELNIKNIREQGKIRQISSVEKLPDLDYKLNIIKSTYQNSKINWEAHEKAKEKIIEFKNDYFNNWKNTDFFIKYWLDNIKDNKCSFCHQELSQQVDLIDIYKNFFDDEYEKTRRKLNEYFESYKEYNFPLDINKLSESYKKSLELHEYWLKLIKLNDLLDLSELKWLIIEINNSYKWVTRDLENKLKDLNSDFVTNDIDILIKNINRANSLISSYNITITKNLLFIDEFKKWLDSSKLPSLIKELEIIDMQLLRMGKSEIDKINLYKDKEKAISTNTWLLDNKRKELNTYTLTMVKDYEKLINDKLKALSIKNFKIWHINDTTHVNGSFVEIVIEMNWKNINLKDYSDDKPSFKNTLSRWDKNSLAFAFFLAFIENNPNKSNLILVFDDPLSSHDENRQRQTVTQIKLLSDSVKQLIILTHKKDFLKILNEIFQNSSSYFQIIKSRTLHNSSINQIDIKDVLSSEYKKTIERLEEYLEDISTCTIWAIKVDIRKVFEDILSVKYIVQLRSNPHMTIFTSKTLDAVFFQKWFLLNIKNELIDLSSFVNNWSHFTEVTWNEEELCWYIENTLELIEQI